MSIEIREANIKESGLLADLFSAHLDEQCAIEPTSVRQPAFRSRDFIEAMLNPRLNQFFSAYDGNRMIGFVRLGILHGDGLLPLDKKVDRLRGSYLARLPVSLLKRLQNGIGAIIERIEKRGSAFSMLQPQTRGYLADLYVAPDYRRKGTGSKLAEQAMIWFQQMGVQTVELNVLDANKAGRVFWRSRGFKDCRILTRKDIGKRPR